MIFKYEETSEKYIKIFSKDNKCVKLIVLSQDKLKEISGLEIEVNNLSELKEITLIIDFPHLAEKLIIGDLYNLIENLNNNIDHNETKLSLIIKNCFIDEKDERNIESINNNNNNKIILNKLEIDDELYSISTINLDCLFPNLKVNELILRRFKFNSKTQLDNFYNFIKRVDCTKLTLDDIFVELIIKKDENDSDYKYLDKYIALLDEVITLDNCYTDISSLTLRDCPLFAIIGNIFTESSLNINIDIDENSLINPSIITKFKIFEGQYDICFDLDSYKIKLESSDNKVDYDGVDYLIFIFKIIAGFLTENEKIKIKDDDDGVEEIDRKNLHKLTFRNFDITKLGYVTNENLTYIEEKDWVLLEKEEKIRKEKWENFERDLKNFELEKEDLSNVKELVFDNCSNFFTKWIMSFVMRQKNDKYQNDLDLLKIKKCGKEYVNLYEILQLKINKLVLFDSPLIIGDHFSDTFNLSFIENEKLGTINNLTIKLNSLDSYGIQYNLNTYKTLEILVELITCPNFNTNITFEFGALANIMTYIACQKYLKSQNFYFNSKDEEKGDNIVVSKIEENKEINNEYIINKSPKFLPKQLYFSSKKYRDYLCYNSFNIGELKGKTITIKNSTIKKQIENFDNLNYLKKIDGDFGNDKEQIKTKMNELKKMHFGSDGFYIERDYKIFFSQNDVGTVILDNINFSSFKDNIMKGNESEAILNLLSDNYEKKNIKENKNKEIFFPNYKIDVKTLNGVLFTNFLLEDFSTMFKYYCQKINFTETKDEESYQKVSSGTYDKKVSMAHYFKTFKNIFECFIGTKKVLTVIINNLKEFKDFYMIFSFYRQLVEGTWIKEKIKSSDNPIITVELPNQKEIKEQFSKFFIMEKDEYENYIYSKINYYYFTSEEKAMIKNENKNIKIEFKQDKEINFYLEMKIDDIYTEIGEFN